MIAALASPAATAEGKYDHVYMCGEPADTEAYCKRAQLALFAQYKALFEGYLEHMFAKQIGKQFGYTAVIFWKSQSPWPSLRGALYDSYLATTGGFWGARAALAQPVHVQMNAHTQTLTVVNLRPQPTPPLQSQLLRSREIVRTELVAASKAKRPIALDTIHEAGESVALMAAQLRSDDSQADAQQRLVAMADGFSSQLRDWRSQTEADPQTPRSERALLFGACDDVRQQLQELGVKVEDR